MADIDIIRSKIYEFRGRRVMLDRDLAALYGVETKNLNKAVKRNLSRFPDDFMFQLSKEEFESLRFQNGTSNQRGGTRYMPYAFTEQGVAMLSSVLNSETAIQMNIGIMRAFVTLRQVLAQPPQPELLSLQNEIKSLRLYVEEILADQNDINEETQMQIELINQSLAELHTRIEPGTGKPRKPVGFLK